MKVFEVEKADWVEVGGHAAAELHKAEGPARVWILRVPPAASYGPLQAASSHHVLVCQHTAGARLHLGPRVFRPLPGQVFESEPGEVFGVVNDTRQEVRFLVARFGPEGDAVPLEQTFEQYLTQVRPDEPDLLSTTSNPAGH